MEKTLLGEVKSTLVISMSYGTYGISLMASDYRDILLIAKKKVSMLQVVASLNNSADLIQKLRKLVPPSITKHRQHPP